MTIADGQCTRILVVGGLGFIGHQVTRTLLEDGHDVHVFDAAKRYPNSSETEEGYQARLRLREPHVREATVHIGDILDADRVSEVMGSMRPEVVIHLASIPVAGIANSDPSGTATQMVTGTSILLEAATAHDVRRFVYVSSSMVYGDFETNPAPEDHPTKCRDIYGNLKLASERMTQAFGINHEMDCVVVRPMSVYGPTGNEDFVITKFVRAALSGAPLNINGEGTSLDLTYVEDAARGIALAATRSEATGDVFNITAGRSRTLVEVADILAQHLEDVRVEIKERRTHYPKRGGLDISKARAKLGYEPRHDLEEGLKKMINAYR